MRQSLLLGGFAQAECGWMAHGKIGVIIWLSVIPRNMSMHKSTSLPVEPIRTPLPAVSGHFTIALVGESNSFAPMDIIRSGSGATVGCYLSDTVPHEEALARRVGIGSTVVLREQVEATAVWGRSGALKLAVVRGTQPADIIGQYLQASRNELSTHDLIRDQNSVCCGPIPLPGLSGNYAPPS